MRVNYVARDGEGTKKQYTFWEYRPVLVRSLWWVSLNKIMGFRLLTASEAKSYVGRTLKPGEIWGRRRNTIKRGR